MSRCSFLCHRKTTEWWSVFALPAAVVAVTSKFQASADNVPWWRSSPFSVFISARCCMIYRSSFKDGARDEQGGGRPAR